MRIIQSDIALGHLAALLTALEYILSILCGLSARAAVHGFWLTALHKRTHGHISGLQRERRMIIKDVIGMIIGVWLVLGVALVESNLRNGIRIGTNMVDSTLCVSTSGHYDPERFSAQRPPTRTLIESWMMQVVETIDCGKNGIATIGVGGTTDRFGVNRDMSAPVCSNATVDVEGGEVEAVLRSLGVHKGFFRPELGASFASDGFLIFPYDASALGLDDYSNKEVPTLPNCESRGISNFITSMHTSFATLQVGSMNLTFTLHDNICKLHGTRSVTVVPQVEIAPCTKDSFHVTIGDCIRQYAERQKFINVVHFNNVSLLTIGSTASSPSYACTSADIEFQYAFVDPINVNTIDYNRNVRLPIIVPLSVKVLKGHCERTIAPLAQAALLYTSAAEWERNDLEFLPRRTRYYAYMMAVSASQYPLHQVKGNETPRENGKCFVRPVLVVTEVPVDWRFGILISGVTTVVIVTILGIGFRMMFTREVWKVGSAQWSLKKLLGKSDDDNKEDNKVVIEIVHIGTGEAGAERPARGRLLCGRSDKGSRGNSPCPERVEYRLRTVMTTGEDDEDEVEANAGARS